MPLEKTMPFDIRIPYILIICVLILTPALALNPQEVLDDPLKESRARVISKSLRCVVCQNQSIDDSDALLARDMRTLVRERLKAGDSNKEVIDYIVYRYGDFVLLKPPLKRTTVVLWMGPLVFILLASLAFYIVLKRENKVSSHRDRTRPLSDEERNRLNKLLEKDIL